MGLTTKNALKSHFTNVKGSDFTLVCGARRLEVHEHILENYSYFERMFRGGWKETTNRSYEAQEDPIVFETLVRFMYGAEGNDKFAACITPSAAACDTLNSLGKLDELERITKKLVNRGASQSSICSLHAAEPEPHEAILACDIAKQFLYYHVAADRYELEKLKLLIHQRLRGLINCAWSHSSVLELVKLILNQTTEHDELNSWMLQEVEFRLPLLLKEDVFESAFATIPTGLVKRLVASGLAKGQVQKNLRYCRHYNSHVSLKSYCRHNVETIKNQENKRACPHCGSTEYLEAARTWLWTEPATTQGDSE